MAEGVQNRLLKEMVKQRGFLAQAIERLSDVLLHVVERDLQRITNKYAAVMDQYVADNLKRSLAAFQSDNVSDGELRFDMALHAQARIAEDEREQKSMNTAQKQAFILRSAGKMLARKGTISDLVGMVSKLASEAGKHQQVADQGKFVPIADLFALGSQLSLLSGYVEAISKNHRDPGERRNLEVLVGEIEYRRKQLNSDLASVVRQIRKLQEKHGVNEAYTYAAEREVYILNNLRDALRYIAKQLNLSFYYRRRELA